MVVDHVNETHKVEFCNKASKMQIYFYKVTNVDSQSQNLEIIMHFL